MYYGDIRLGDTIDIQFTTRSFTTGAPTTLTGGVISAYVGNSITQITAGITLTPDLDGVTGFHNIRVVATSGNGYGTATNVHLVITTGTVGGVSVVGEVVGAFSIENRSALMPTTAARTAFIHTDGGVLLADAQAHGGTLGSSTATLALSRASIVSQTAATAGLTVTGNTTGSGAVFTSGAGATGDGIQVTANSTNGNGLKLTKTGTGVALAAPTTDIVLAKTTNITGFNDIAATAIVSSGAITTSGGAVSTVTTLTNLPAITANWLTATGINADAFTAAKFAADVGAEFAAATWRDAVAADFTQAGSIGLSVMNGVALGTGLTVASVSGSVGSVTGAVGSVTGAVGSVTGAVGSVTGNVGGNVVGTVASVVGAVGSVTGNVGGNVVGTVGSVVTKTGYELAATGLDLVLVSDLAGVPTSTAKATDALAFVFMSVRNARVTNSATGEDTVANNAGAVIATAPVSDSGTAFTKGKYV